MSTDLKYLEEMTGGAHEIMKEMIQLFLQQLDETVADLSCFYENRNWPELGRMAHKLKSSALVMGAKDMAQTMITIETCTKDADHPEYCKQYIEEFVNQAGGVREELKEFLTTIE